MRNIPIQEFEIAGVQRHTESGTYDELKPGRNWSIPAEAVGASATVLVMKDGLTEPRVVTLTEDHRTPNLKPTQYRWPDWKPRALTGQVLALLEGRPVYSPLNSADRQPEFMTILAAQSLAAQIERDIELPVTVRPAPNDAPLLIELPSVADGLRWDFLVMDGVRVGSAGYVQSQRYQNGVGSPGKWKYSDGKLTFVPKLPADPPETWSAPFVPPANAIGVKLLTLGVGEAWVVEMPDIPADRASDFGPNDRSNLDKALVLLYKIAALLGVE